MIIRARPKYLLDQHFDKTTEYTHMPGQELFFNSGRAALKFFLKCYAKHNPGNLRIGMQSFNCRAVMEGALQAGWQVVLHDIDHRLTDFSIGINQVESFSPAPDVLLLTHYQGIPNQDYEKISTYCKEHGILLIDDLSQTEGSSINNKPTGSLAHCSIHSFAYDKPFSSLFGGSIDISNLNDPSLVNQLLQNYEELKVEPDSQANDHLEILRLLSNYTAEECYFKGLDRYEFLKILKQLPLPTTFLIKLFKFPPFRMPYRLLAKIFKRTTDHTINEHRLQPIKIALIQAQRDNFQYDPSESIALEQFLHNKGIVLPTFPDSDIKWNRYSILDESGKLLSLMKNYPVEVGSFNWPNPLHKLYNESDKIHFSGGFPNSDKASNHVVNIPVWSSFFQRLVKS